MAETRINTECFLPIREGVSHSESSLRASEPFPPYTGGCIGHGNVRVSVRRVSSLYGRVYRTKKKHSVTTTMFPPYTGGCIAFGKA